MRTLVGTESRDLRRGAGGGDQRRATLHLEINGAAIDTALVALRDAVNTEHPEMVLGTLHGKFLSRHADWIADAPPLWPVVAAIARHAERADARDTI